MWEGVGEGVGGYIAAVNTAAALSREIHGRKTLMLMPGDSLINNTTEKIRTWDRWLADRCWNNVK